MQLELLYAICMRYHVYGSLANARLACIWPFAKVGQKI